MVIEGNGHAPVSGMHTAARSPLCLLVLGHGAGAPMTHPWMEALAEALAGEGISTLRYNFRYMEAGRRRPDPVRRLVTVTASAVRTGRELAGRLPLFAGGRSMGGRMTSTLVAERAQGARAGGAERAREEGGEGLRPAGGPEATGPDLAEELSGLVFFGFPLHAPGRRENVRGEHLVHVPCPMLFHQGTRDRLAALDLLRPLLDRVGPRATLHVCEGGDHSFATPKRLGRTRDDVLAELAGITRSWAESVLAAGADR